MQRLTMTTLKRTAAFLTALSLIAAPAFAQAVRVVDGDTIKLDCTTYRLWGIDAPETKQDCDGQRMGVAATGALEDLVRGKVVTCEERTKDRYGRTVALCRADGIDLSAAMVQSGWAFAFLRYSRDYVALEAQARDENIGLHPYHCDLPWAWRPAVQRREHTIRRDGTLPAAPRERSLAAFAYGAHHRGMKSPYPNPRHAAQRNLARRIERFLDGIERADRRPDRWEVHHVLNALGLMTLGDFHEGEHSMMLAEREPSQRAGHHAEAADASTEMATLPQLRERLAKALTGEVS